MDNFHLVFFPLLIVMALLSFSIRKKLKHLLFEKEPNFCKSISLTDSMLTDSPTTSWNLALLVAFSVNKKLLTDDEVLRLLKKAKLMDWSFYVVFLVYLILIIKSFAGK